MEELSRSHGRMLATLFMSLFAFASSVLLRGAEERGQRRRAQAVFSSREICVGWSPQKISPLGLVCAPDSAQIPRALEGRFGRPAGCTDLRLRTNVQAGRVLTATRLSNGSCVLFPGGFLPGPLRLMAHGKIRPNADSPKDLRALPGIGQVRAEAIVEERLSGGPFEDGEDLKKRVRGIGPKTLEGIAPLISFDTETVQDSNADETISRASF